MSSRPRSHRVWFPLTLLALGVSALVGACASEDPEPDGPLKVDPGPDLPNTATGGCDNEGAIRDCSIDLGTTESGAHSCFVGVQSCVDGSWSACGDGDVQELALGAPVACPANPCDPACEQYDETPATPPASGGGVPPNAFGSVSDLPGGFQSKGLCPDNNMPCLCDQTVQDCQFDYFCDVDDTCQPYNDGEFSNPAPNPAPHGGHCHFNVTVKPPCSTGIIQVCNRGCQQAPAGLAVGVFPGNSGKMGQCASGSQTPPAVDAVCFTPTTIEPGECIPVTGCEAALLAGNISNIVVNHPDTGTPYVKETNCADNWASFNKNAGGGCQCANLSTSVTATSLSMYVLLDNSGSMSSFGSPNWGTATAGLTNFFQDNVTSPGLGVAFRLWPDGPSSAAGCTGNGGVCSAAACETPDVARAALTVDAAPVDTHEAALIANMPGASTGGFSDGTPMSAALQGGVDWAVAYEGANAGEKAVVVLITDGDPLWCDTNMTNIRAIAAAGLAAGVETYTVGLNGGNVTDLSNIAADGGGLTFDLTAGNAAAFTAAMAAIQIDASSCDYPVSGVSAAATTVTYVDSGGGSNPMTQVANSGACTAGLDYYFDNVLNPTQLSVCPAACSTVNADVGARVEITAACQPFFTAVTYSDTYEAVCVSPLGPEWTFLAYDTTSPGDSSVDFEIRTSSSLAGLSGEAYTLVSTATNGAPDAGIPVVPPNPIDLQSTLSGAQYRSTWLEMQATMFPTSDNSQGSTLEQWQVWYTCQPQE